METMYRRFLCIPFLLMILGLAQGQSKGLQSIATFHTGLQPVAAIRTGLRPIATFQTGVQPVSTFHTALQPGSTLQGNGNAVIKKIMVSSMGQPVSMNEGIVEVAPPSGGTHVITEEKDQHGGRHGHKMKKLGKKKHHRFGGGRKFGKKHRHHKKHRKHH